MPEILLIDDAKHDLMFMIEAFKVHNLADKIKAFQDSEEALNYISAIDEHLANENFENLRLVILDLEMPKVNGFEVLQRIRTSKKIGMVPVVIFSSSSLDRDKIESYRLGANSYVVKPNSYENFVNAVNQIGTYWVFCNTAIVPSMIF